MLRYARAAIGLVAAIFVAAFIHSLMAPRLAEGAYGAAGASGWLAFVVDLLAFGGTWVTVAGMLANRALGRVLESLLAGTVHTATPAVGSLPEAAAMANPAPALSLAEALYSDPGLGVIDSEPDPWSASEQLAAQLSVDAIKAGNADDYLRAFRLLHPKSDAALAEAMPSTPKPAPSAATTTRSRSNKGK